MERKEKNIDIYEKDIFTSRGMEEFTAYSTEFQNEFLKKFRKTTEMTKVDLYEE